MNNFFDNEHVTIIWDAPVLIIRPKKFSSKEEDNALVMKKINEFYSRINRSFVHIFDGEYFEGEFHLSMLHVIRSYANFFKSNISFYDKYCACTAVITYNQAFKLVLNSFLVVYQNRRPIKCIKTLNKSIEWCSQYLDITSSRTYRDTVAVF